MLPKPNRLKKKLEIEAVFKKGRKFKEDFLILIMAQNILSRPRFGFVVSGKVSKRAVVRNKLRRYLRELVRLRLKKIKSGLDMLLIAAPGLETKDYRETEETINRLFQKAKILI